MPQEAVDIVCPEVAEPIAHSLQSSDLLADGTVKAFLSTNG